MITSSAMDAAEARQKVGLPHAGISAEKHHGRRLAASADMRCHHRRIDVVLSGHSARAAPRAAFADCVSADLGAAHHRSFLPGSFVCAPRQRCQPRIQWQDSGKALVNVSTSPCATMPSASRNNVFEANNSDPGRSQFSLRKSILEHTRPAEFAGEHGCLRSNPAVRATNRSRRASRTTVNWFAFQREHQRGSGAAATDAGKVARARLIVVPLSGMVWKQQAIEARAPSCACAPQFIAPIALRNAKTRLQGRRSICRPRLVSCFCRF